MTEQDEGRKLWDATGPRPLPPNVSPSIRGEKQRPADKPTDKEKNE